MTQLLFNISCVFPSSHGWNYRKLNARYHNTIEQTWTDSLNVLGNLACSVTYAWWPSSSSAFKQSSSSCLLGCKVLGYPDSGYGQVGEMNPFEFIHKRKPFLAFRTASRWFRNQYWLIQGSKALFSLCLISWGNEKEKWSKASGTLPWRCLPSLKSNQTKSHFQHQIAGP